MGVGASRLHKETPVVTSLCYRIPLVTPMHLLRVRSRCVAGGNKPLRRRSCETAAVWGWQYGQHYGRLPSHLTGISEAVHQCHSVEPPEGLKCSERYAVQCRTIE